MLCYVVGPVLTCVSKDYNAHISPPSSCTKVFYLVQTTPTGVGDISWSSSGCYKFFEMYSIYDKLS
jgi:hypothetical protein